ncbi:hypothetical protein M446_4259 [Methylobacterium sp. 4-46]|uniref:hypothetical protein n=1 Tax=unclassified Methylobacterium TaxID=2615210 RepID=UPI000152C610|nr:MULTISPECIES: hypothetical protein [Methylobacterium]ACA18608.1 hypothetical protein M446_4259 [Methylobacterium sp. 4-46]WFT77889.1 hypothetical protein QA634_21605 [Methylobacterium nodulans]
MAGRWRRWGLQGAGVAAAWLGLLALAGGDGAAALALRPGLDPVDPVRPAVAPAAPAVRVILAAPWAHGTAFFAEEARQVARAEALSGSR